MPSIAAIIARGADVVYGATRTNLVPNPALVTDASNWLCGIAPVERVVIDDKTWALAKSGTYTYAKGVGVVGKYYAASIRVKGPPGTSLYIANSDYAVGEWLALRYFTIPASGEIVAVSAAHTVGVYGTNLYFGLSGPRATPMYLTEALVEEVSGPGQYPAGDYFDGSTPSTDTALYSWTGTPNASTSTEITR